MSFKFKRGATFAPTVTYTPAVDGLANLIGATVTGRIVTAAGATVADLTGDVADDGLSFVLTPADPDTSEWPLASVEFDVRVSLGGVVVYSDRGKFSIVATVTPAP